MNANAQEAAQPTVKFDMTLTKDEAEHIAAFVMDDNEATDDVLRLLVGDGHSGYGLYAAHPEYPDEGAVFVKGLASPSAQPPEHYAMLQMLHECKEYLRADPSTVGGRPEADRIVKRIEETTKGQQ